MPGYSEQGVTTPVHRWVAEPHVPLLQAPAQHWEPELHGVPSASHALFPQTPLVHLPAQHCASEEQLVPSPRQDTLWQPPLVHEPLQHWASYEQDVPMARHWVPPQTPSPQ
jgi:hypothetical protein